MTRFGNTLTILIGASLGVAGCSGSIEPPDTTNPTGTTPGGDSTTGSTTNTFDHDNDQDAWALINRLTTQGPPSFTSRMHDCPKVTYANLGRVLTSVGVNLANTAAKGAAPTAGDIYKAAAPSIGAPIYANRIRETVALSTSGASSEFDIFAAAAPEVITALPTLARCSGAALFDANNNCNLDAISCMIGVPATAAHQQLCQIAVANASSPTIGQHIAVAAMLAAAYTCD